MSKKNPFENSPWSCSCNNDGSMTILVRDKGKEIVDITLDVDNRIKLALVLLDSYSGNPLYLISNYNPTPQGVSVHLHQKQLF